MSKPGRLIVFEGPDDVGKTTLAKLVVEHLNQRGEKTTYKSFPGQDEGTLGQLVYQIHHQTAIPNVRPTPLALQALHIAAHLDTIEREIKPALERGTTVVLDRYWWSTHVYGLISDAPFRALSALIMVEELFWGDIRPTKLFCVLTDRPHVKHYFSGDRTIWQKAYLGYQTMLQVYGADPGVQAIGNNGTIESALQDIITSL